MDVLFYFESLLTSLHHHAKSNIQRFGSLSSLLIIFSVHRKLRVISILHPCALIFLIFIYIHAFLDESFIQFIQQIELTGKIYHRAGFTFLIYHEQWRNTCRTCHIRIIRTKSRCNVHDTRTVFCRHIIPLNNPEAFIADFPHSIFGNLYRFHPRNELFIFHAHQFRTFIFGHYLKRNQLISRFVIFQIQVRSFRIKVSI